jgi:activating signal cointegrator 1
MKALSLWQPWASAIACGAKRIETRSWETSYRGPLLIHAAKTKDWLPYREIRSDLGSERGEVGFKAVMAAKIPSEFVFPLGALIAVAELVACLPTSGGREQLQAMGELHDLLDANPQERALGDYSPGRYGWVLSNVHALPTPIPYTGRQGLFDVPDAMLRQLGVEVE